jgi:predicted nucleic acid-binding Zn ribbon protein
MADRPAFRQVTNLLRHEFPCDECGSAVRLLSSVDLMAQQPCPVCRHDTLRWLEASSKNADVNYYRCDACAHVWTVSKSDPAAPLTIITNNATSREEIGE